MDSGSSQGYLSSSRATHSLHFWTFLWIAETFTPTSTTPYLITTPLDIHPPQCATIENNHLTAEVVTFQSMWQPCVVQDSGQEVRPLNQPWRLNPHSQWLSGFHHWQATGRHSLLYPPLQWWKFQRSHHQDANGPPQNWLQFQRARTTCQLLMSNKDIPGKTMLRECRRPPSKHQWLQRKKGSQASSRQGTKRWLLCRNQTDKWPDC